MASPSSGGWCRCQAQTRDVLSTGHPVAKSEIGRKIDGLIEIETDRETERERDRRNLPDGTKC